MVLKKDRCEAVKHQDQCPIILARYNAVHYAGIIEFRRVIMKKEKQGARNIIT